MHLVAGRNDDSNNNTKQKPRHAVVTSPHSTNCSDASDDDTSMSSYDDTITKNSYTCQNCELTVKSAKTYLHHLVDEHGQVFDIFECDLCEYATRCQDNLPRHRKRHFGSDASPLSEFTDLRGTSAENEKIADACEVSDHEGCDAHKKLSVSEGQKDGMSMQDGEQSEACVKGQGQTADNHVFNETKDKQMKAVDTELVMLHKTDVSVASADCKTPGTSNETHWTHPADGCAAQSPSSETYFQAAASTAVEDKQLEPISDRGDGGQHLTSKLMCAGSPPGTDGGKRRTYTPVREAVDPGKYMIIHEIDGTKYACSKCGNIYKWRKSLNKHWKEKHGGQTPDMPVAATHYGVPSVTKKEKKPASTTLMHFSPLSATSGNIKKSPASSQNSLKQMESQWQHFGAGNFQTSRTMPRLLSSSASKKRPASLVDEYASGYIKRACSYNSKSRVSSPAFPADMKAMSVGYNYYPDIYPTSPFVVTPKPLYVNHRSCDSVMKLSPTPSLPTPPTAHAHYMTGSVMAMVADIPVDLSSQCSSVYSDNSEENVLDLSKDSAFTNLKTSSPQLPGPQAEPLDFSVRPHKSVESAARKQCSVCAYVSKSTVDYAEHMAVHSTKNDHRCATCEQPFHNIRDLNDHFQQCHLDVLNADTDGLDCTRDDNGEPLSYRTTEKTQLLKYLTKKEATPSFCVVCGVKFEGQKSLAAHFAQMHPSLASHGYLSPHPHVGVKLEIDTCSGSKQEQHRPLDVEESQPALLQCRLCTFVARTTSELAAHQLKHSLNISLCCKMCGCSCQSKNDLFLHYNTHHGDVSVPGSHDLKLDISSGSLEAYHSDDSENTVPMDNLTQIMVGDTVIDLTADGTMVVIPQAPEETTSPLSTKASFGRPSKKCSGVNSGVNALTPGGSSASAEMLLPYKCSVCEYRARWPSEITQHMKNHSDEKPYSCPHCTYKSKWKWDVVKHLKRCGGGGTVKDVIDNTRRKKQLQPLTLTMLSDNELPKLSPEGVGPTNRDMLSGGPPNVTVQQMVDSHATAVVSPMQCAQEVPLQINPEDLALSPSEKTRHVQSQLYCQKCPFIGNSPAELKRHSRVHSEEKPFICKTCGYCSKWKCDLKKHLRAYNHTPAVPLVYGGHGRKPVEWYSNMLMNNRPTSDTETSIGNEGPMDASSAFLSAVYRCSQCPYVTGKMQLLEHHMKTHSVVARKHPGKLKCKKCDFEAKDLPGFVQHKLTHSTKHTDKQGAAWEIDVHGRKSSKMPRTSIHKMNGLTSNDHCAPSDDSSASDNGHAAEYGYSSDTDCEDMAENYRKFILPPGKHLPTSPPASVNYRCVHCPYKTFDRVDFEKHIPVHVGSGYYNCQWCSWTTNRLNLLYQHAQQAHSLELEEEDKEAEKTHPVEAPETTSRCEAPNLQRAYDSRAEELGHLNDEEEGEKEEHDADKPCNQRGYVAKHGCSGTYQCNFCDYSVDKHHVLLYHLRIVHNHVQGITSTELSNDCCTKLAVDTQKQAEEVDWEMHKKGLPEGIHAYRTAGQMCYACRKCTHVTGDVSNALNHAKPHGARKRYTCEYCDYSLDQLRGTIDHMHTFHVQADDRSETSKDYHKQKDKAQLKLQHKAGFQCVTVRVNGKVQYRCLTCAAASRSKQRTLEHIISQHVKSRRYACHRCGYKATTSSLRRKHSLKRHYKAKLPKTATSTQSDSTLGNNFNKDKAMMQHCMICPFYSDSTAELMIHNDHHRMALPFQCDLCSYSHQQLNQIYQHRKLHKDDPSFKTSVPAKLLINASHFVAGDTAGNLDVADESSSSSGTDDAAPVDPTGVKLTCSRCTYTCSSLKSYQVHKESHGANRKYRCDYCDWSVDGFGQLRSHRCRQHSSEPGFNPNRSSSELDMNEGGDDSTPALKTQHNCHFCPHVSDNSEASDRHEACHKVKSRHSCGTCSFSVDELPLLQLHQKLHEHIASSHKHIECPRCPFRTHSHSLLAMHARMHGAVNKYLCEFCDYSVSRFNLMGQHMRVHGVKPVKQNSNRSTKTPRSRYAYNNKRMVCGGDTELLTCDRCPYQACSLTSMAQHSLGHSKRARHSCPYCDFTSMKMTQLTAHINLHFPGTSFDLQKTSQLVKINGYDDNHAGVTMDLIERPDENGSDSACHFCDRTFSNSADLQQHEQMHLIGGGTC